MFDAIKWRFELRVLPHLLLHESLSCAIARKFRNFSRARGHSPMVYIFADASNIGDRVSALGVQMLAGATGVELFASKVALPATFRTLKWLQEHRADARVVVGGGGLLQECFDPFWRGLLKTKLRFGIFGVGANELKGRNLPPRETLDAISDRAVILHARDEWSLSLFSGANAGKFSVGVCPSVNYLRSKHMACAPLRPYLLHVLHPVDIKMAGGDPVKISTSVREIAGELGLIYDETDHIKEGLSSLVARYQRAQFVVTSRLHGCIFSYALGVPFLPIATDKKTYAFVDTHLSGHPVATVSTSTSELRSKLLFSASFHQIDYDGAMHCNVAAMYRLLETFCS